MDFLQSKVANWRISSLQNCENSIGYIVWIQNSPLHGFFVTLKFAKSFVRKLTVGYVLQVEAPVAQGTAATAALVVGVPPIVVESPTLRKQGARTVLLLLQLLLIQVRGRLAVRRFCRRSCWLRCCCRWSSCCSCCRSFRGASGPGWYGLLPVQIRMLLVLEEEKKGINWWQLVIMMGNYWLT